jgi:hypothetical protein
MMIIEQASANVYTVRNVLDSVAVYNTQIAFDYFYTDATVADTTGIVVQEIKHVHQYEYKQQVLEPVRRDLEPFVGEDAIQSSFELWRCYPGYSAEMVTSTRPVVARLFIMMGNSGAEPGIEWLDEDKEYSVPYAENRAVLIVDSHRVPHAVKTTVREMAARRYVIIEWSTNDPWRK